ncbi:hypothetical protein EDB89DRAFT_1909197 [Lactarius sanguifluus]|nr:hypothetical protein EDB89DRAFT_1909197 [Lactarius sanguifluus]
MAGSRKRAPSTPKKTPKRQKSTKKTQAKQLPGGALEMSFQLDVPSIAAQASTASQHVHFDLGPPGPHNRIWRERTPLQVLHLPRPPISVAKVQFSAVQAPPAPNPNLNFVQSSEPEPEPDPNPPNAFGNIYSKILATATIIVTVVVDWVKDWVVVTLWFATLHWWGSSGGWWLQL